MGEEILENKEEIFNRLKKRTELNLDNGCWLWQGALNNVIHGHGIMKLWKHSPKFYVHRLSAYIHFDYDLDNKELQVNHYCSNQNCWNPEHIYIGTQAENMQDKIKDGTYYNPNTNKTHCKRGHEFNIDNTYHYQKSDGTYHRSCKECMKANFRKWYHKDDE